MRRAEEKLISLEQLVVLRQAFKRSGKMVAFTNGCFDILHVGHVQYLQLLRAQADVLIVGLNSDVSVRQNKGEARPVNGEEDRATVLAALECIDYVVVFDEDEPKALIETLIPDVLIKGADWAHYVSGRECVEAHGGRVVLAELVPGKSTTSLIKKMAERT